jgi:DNA repair protein SbcC/Rad50
MIIKSVKLGNIRSYTKQLVEFPQGSVMISGDIGSGKSTILLAIEFALFGIMRSLPGSSLLRKGKNKGYVELEFSVGKNNITIKRTLKKQGDDIRQDSGYIIVNGRKQEGTAVELKIKVLDLLGYPKELVTKTKSLIYRYTVYTPQEEMKQILMEEKETRLETLRKVFQIDKYKRIKENSQVLIKEIRENSRELQGFTADLDEKKKSMNEKKQEIKEISKKTDEIKPKIDEIKSKLRQKKDSLEKIEKDIKKLNEIKNKIELHETRLKDKINIIQTYNEEIKKIEKEKQNFDNKIKELKIEPVKQNEKEIEEKINEREKKYNELFQKKTALNEKISYIYERKKQLQNEINEKSNNIKNLSEKKELSEKIKNEINEKQKIEKKLRQFEKNIDDLNCSIRESETKKQRAENIKKTVLENNRCPTCTQELTEEHKKNISNEENKNIRELSEKITKNKETKKKISEELEKTKRLLDKINEKQTMFRVLESEIKNIETVSKELNEKNKILEKLSSDEMQMKKKLDSLKDMNLEQEKKAISELKEVLKKINDSKTRLNEKQNMINLRNEKEKSIEEKSRYVASLKREVGGINNQKIQLNDQLKIFEKIDYEYEKIRKENDELLEKEKKLEIKKAELEKEAEGIKKTIEILEKEINEKEKARSKLNYLKQLRNWIDEYFVKLMSMMEKYVMLRVHNEFNELFKKWFNILMEEENIAARLDEEFTPVIEQNEYEISIEHLSGGERTSLALAYRLALNKVINDIVEGIKTKDLIILDEPTDGFSTNQLDKVKNVFDELDARQSIIVSHEIKIESFVSNIMKVNKEEHVSSVSS